MVVAGLLFAAGALALADAARRAGPRVALAAGLGGAAALGLLVALPQLPSVGEIGRGALFPCIYLGIALAVFALGWTHASAAVGRFARIGGAARRPGRRDGARRSSSGSRRSTAPIRSSGPARSRAPP